MFSKLRPRLTYANVVSTVCLFVVLGGSAVAATVITGKDVKNGSLTGKDVKNSSLTGGDVKNKSLTPNDFNGSVQGPKGDVGAQGPKGDAGARGVPGADGATGSALLSGVVDGFPPVAQDSAVGRFATPTGYSTALGGGPLSAAPRAILSPGRALVARDLAVRTFNDVPAGGTVQVTLWIDKPPIFSPGAEDDETLTCTIVGTDGVDDRACQEPGPVAIPPASTMWILLVGDATAPGSGPVDPGPVRWGITTEPDGP